MKLHERIKLFFLGLWRRWNRRCPNDGEDLELWPSGFADWDIRCRRCGYKRSL